MEVLGLVRREDMKKGGGMRAEGGVRKERAEG
jgi:hypothetical protein